MVESQFASDDEKAAFRKLKRHVARHLTFPHRIGFERRIGIPYSRTPEPTSYYLDEFVRRAKFNAMRGATSAFMEAMAARDADEAERLLNEMHMAVRAQSASLGGAVRTFSEVASQVKDEFLQARMAGGMLGITTGWPEVDAIVGGYVKGDIVSWIARLGKGKTMLLLYQALKAAESGKRVLFVSPEVPDVQLVRRIIGMITGLNPRFIARGMLSTPHWNRMVQSIDNTNLPIMFAAGRYKKSTDFIQAMIDEVEPDIVFVDAMYLVYPEKKRAGSGSRREVISDVAEELKDIAVSNDIPIVLSAQFNRQAVKEKKDDGSDRRTKKDPLAHLDVHKIGETDVIAQISSLVFVIEYGDPPNAFTTRWIGIKKGREGDSGHWLINYRFSPFNMSVINANDNRRQAASPIDEEAIDEDFGEDGEADAA